MKALAMLLAFSGCAPQEGCVSEPAPYFGDPCPDHWFVGALSRDGRITCAVSMGPRCWVDDHATMYCYATKDIP